MATLIYKKGRGMIQFVDQDGAKRTLRLGAAKRRDAQLINSHVSDILDSRRLGMTAPAEALAWVASLTGKLHARLVALGIIHPESKPATKAPEDAVEFYCSAYIAKRTDLKKSSRQAFHQTQNSLVQFFGKTKRLSEITRGDVVDWHLKMHEKYSSATISMYVKKARQIFRDAMKRPGVLIDAKGERITDNPFMEVRAGSMKNKRRWVYVPAADINKVIEHCPDHEWKFLFAIARFGGLRIPSESDGLTWDDLLFSDEQFRIRSPKTERHEGKHERMFPKLPELRTYIAEALKHRGDSQYVFPKLRGRNLATHGKRIVRLAGLEPWAKFFQNLRASCETDMAMWCPLHLVCAFIGNSAAVAMEHYIKPKPSDFAWAIGAAKSAATNGQNGVVMPTPTLQISPQMPFAGIGKRSLQGRLFALDLRENLENTHSALRNLLHGTKSYAAHIDSLMLAKLASEVHAARVGGAL